MSRNEYQNIDNLDGHQFEDLIEELVKRMGFLTEERKLSADGGIDIIANCDKPLFEGKYIIQCKKHSKPIGEPILRDLYGVITAERANKGILITNSTFSLPAQNFAKDKPIELIDLEKLKKLLNEYLVHNSMKASSSNTWVSLNAKSNDKIDFSQIRKNYYAKHGRNIRDFDIYLTAMKDLLEIPIKRINDSLFRLRNNLVYIQIKKISDISKCIENLENSRNKSIDLTQIFGNLYELVSEGYYTNTVTGHKIYSGSFDHELLNIINLIIKEYENQFSISYPENFKKLHALICSYWDQWFDYLNVKFQQLDYWIDKKIVNNEDLENYKKENYKLIINFDEYSKELILLKNRISQIPDMVDDIYDEFI